MDGGDDDVFATAAVSLCERFSVEEVGEFGMSVTGTVPVSYLI